MSERLVVRGAREHNLQNVNVDLPRDKLIVFTGISGSGKSSLAFDTIYAEGQRRYVESLSSYARQFLGQMDKPDVDFIEGLSPAISIDQKTASRNPRSTVGTITEIYDYLRLLFARIGVPHCPNDGTVVRRQSPQQIVDRIMELPEGTRFQVLAPIVRGRKGEYEGLLEDMAKQGFTRARVDGEVVDLAERTDVKLARYEQHTIEVVVDRLVAKTSIVRRLTDSLETALRLADGVAEVQIIRREGEEAPVLEGEDDSDDTLTFSQHLGCPKCGLSFEELAPRNFSFNSPYGACATCSGIGTKFEVDPALVVPNPDLTIEEGAINPWKGQTGEYFQRLLTAVAENNGFKVTTPWKKLKKPQQEMLLYGTGKKLLKVQYRNRHGSKRTYTTAYEGIVPFLQRRHGDSESDWVREQIEGYMREVPCADCGGRPPQAGVARGDDRRPPTSRRSPGCRSARPREFLESIELSERDRMIAERVVKEIDARLKFLLDVGLDYLTLDRSRGHARRRRGAAHPPGQPDRVGSGRRAVRARRAVDRPAPARQPPPHRDADPPARAGQHRDRRRARRGHDRGRRPRRRHRPGRGRARRASDRVGLGRRAEEEQGVDHRRLPVGPQEDRRADAAPRARTTTGSPSAAPPSTTCKNIDVSIPLGYVRRRSPACRARASRRWSTTSCSPR